MQGTKTMTAYRSSLKDKIVDVAMHAFAQRGIRAVKMDDIAQELAISKRTLYELFENKEVLLFEGVKKYKKLKDAEMERLAAESHNVIDFVLNVYRNRIEDSRKTTPQFYSDIVKYPSIKNYLTQDKEERQNQFLRFMRRGVTEGYFRSDVNYHLVVRMFEALSSYMNDNELYQRYGFEELFSNMVFITLRGFCTLKGIEKLDNSLTALADSDRESGL